jgi:hypothetical protein
LVMRPQTWLSITYEGRDIKLLKEIFAVLLEK